MLAARSTQGAAQGLAAHSLFARGADAATGGEGVYQDMADEQMTRSLVDGGTFGLAGTLYAQLAPHVPQLFASVDGLTHRPPHTICAPVQVTGPSRAPASALPESVPPASVPPASVATTSVAPASATSEGPVVPPSPAGEPSPAAPS